MDNTMTVQLWLSNDQGIYESSREVILSVLPDYPVSQRDTAIEVAGERLSDRIADEVEEIVSDGMFYELLIDALNDVDWSSIVESLTDEDDFDNLLAKDDDGEEDE